MMELGAVGGISIVANLIPKAWKEMIESFLQGNKEQAREINTLYSSLVRGDGFGNEPSMCQIRASVCSASAIRI